MKKKHAYTYVTLLSSDDFLTGVVMLNWSLKRVKSAYPLLVLCSNSVSKNTLSILRKRHLDCSVLEESIVVDTSEVNTAKGYDHWNKTFDKLFIWSLTQYKKVVFLDSDMHVIKNIDYLFDCPHMSAVRADQWNEPGLDKLNSGLMVIEPNMEELRGLKKLWESGEIKLKNVGDQDVIRAYFKDWGRKQELTLSPGLNVLYSEVSHGVIKEKQVAPVSVIHYIGSRKPWMVSPRAVWRRSKNNFLGRYLLCYAYAMYIRFPSLLFNKAKKAEIL